MHAAPRSVPCSLLLLLALSGPASAQVPLDTEWGTQAPILRRTRTNFGATLSRDQDWLVAGAPWRSADYERGHVALYVDVGGEWRLHTHLYHPEIGEGRFGRSVSLSGDRLAVGAPSRSILLAPKVLVYRRQATEWVLEANLEVGSAANDFGAAVALDGDTLAVGAVAAGVVHLWHHDGSEWSAQGSLTASDGTAGDLFGAALDLEGDRLVVGAPFASPGGLSSAGAAYVFERSGTVWTEVAALTAVGPSPGALLGSAVSLDGDGVAVGAPYDGGAGAGAGAAHLFAWDGTAWREEAKLVSPAPATNAHFGSALQLAGTRLAVGAPDREAGTVFTFVSTAGEWAPEQALASSDSQLGERFGESVVLSGGQLVAGCGDRFLPTVDVGSAFCFELDGGVWTGPTELSQTDARPGAGFASAIEAGYFGAPGDDLWGPEAGAVYRFASPLKLTAPDALAGDRFGAALASAHDQYYSSVWLAVGAPGRSGGDGSVFLYDDDPERPVFTVELQPESPGGAHGTALAMIDGWLFVGAPRDGDAGASAGAVYVYERSGSDWSSSTKLLASDAAAGAGFGQSLEALDDRLLVGAPGADGLAGAVYAFALQGGAWVETDRLQPAGSAPGQLFGAALDLDDAQLVVGAPGDQEARGAAYLWVSAAGSWSELTRLASATGSAGDRLGTAVELSGSVCIASAPHADGVTPGAGRLVGFLRLGVTWSERPHLAASDGFAGDAFGASISSAGGDSNVSFYAASPSSDRDQPDGGLAYRFSVQRPAWYESFCLGTGSEGACPCGNETFGLGGCGNSVDGFSPLLHVSEGTDSASDDDVSFLAGWLPQESSALLFVGTATFGRQGQPFGDGLRCVGGAVVRLGAVTTSGSYGTATWGPGLGALGGWGAGDTRHFQTWYRDPDGPCGSGFNVTNAVTLVFGP